MRVPAKPFVINCADVPRHNPSALRRGNKLTLHHVAGPIHMDKQDLLTHKAAYTVRKSQLILGDYW